MAGTRRGSATAQGARATRRPRLRRGTLLATMLLIALPLAEARAALADWLPTWAGAHLRLGFGGNAKFSPGDVSDELQPTAGFALEADWRVIPHLHVGGLFGVGFWNTQALSDASVGRSSLVDLDATVRGVYPLSGIDLDLFAQLPVGLTVAIPNDDYIDASGARGNAETGLGWNIGLLAGAVWYLRPEIGLMGQAGWRHRAFTNKNGPTDVDTVTDQVAVDIGAFYIF